MKRQAPPKHVCEIDRLVERCPHTTCEHFVPGIPNKPLHMLPVCTRVTLMASEATGGMTQSSVARWTNSDQSNVSKIERRAIKKLRLLVQRLEVS